jgi:hypothetical protein
MSLFPSIRTASILLAVGILIFSGTNALAASAPVSVSQLALYQGADRETILIQGAKKEPNTPWKSTRKKCRNGRDSFKSFSCGEDKENAFK